MAMPPPVYNPATDPYGYFAPPSNFLSKAEYLKKMPGGNYQNYRTWVTKTRARRAGARQSQWKAQLGPFAGITPPPSYYQQLAQHTYPILTDAEIQNRAKTLVSSQIDPIIKQITAANESATRTGISRIQSYAKGAAADLATIAPEIAAAYSTGINEQAAVDKALTASMGGAGEQAAFDVGAQLQSMGASGAETAAASGSLGTLGAGAAVEEGGLASASMSQMIADKATETAYAAKFPGFATLVGQQQVGNFSSTQAQALNDAIGQLTAQVPGLTQEMVQDMLTQNQQARAGRADLITGGQQSAAQAAIAFAGLRSDAAQRAATLAGIKLQEKGATARNNADIKAANAVATAKAEGQSQKDYNKKLSAAQNFAINKIVTPSKRRKVSTPGVPQHQATAADVAAGRAAHVGDLVGATGATTKVTQVPRTKVAQSVISYFRQQFGDDAPVGFLIGQAVNALRAGGYVDANPTEVARLLGYKIVEGKLVKLTGKDRTPQGGTTSKTVPNFFELGTRSYWNNPPPPPSPEDKAAAKKYANEIKGQVGKMVSDAWSHNIPRSEAYSEIQKFVSLRVPFSTVAPIINMAFDQQYGKKQAQYGKGVSSKGPAYFSDKVGARMTVPPTILPGAKKKYIDAGGHKGYVYQGKNNKWYFKDKWGNWHTYNG